MRALLVGGLVVAASACSSGADERAQSKVGPPNTTVAPTTTTAPEVTSPDQLAAPPDPRAAIEVLTRVERGLRTDDRDPIRLARLGWEQQKAYGTLLAHPDWQGEVLAGLPDDVRTIAQANLDAGSALAAPDLGPPLQSLPDWTILVPKPVDELLGDYQEAEASTGIPWAYFAAIHFVETKTGRIRGNSTAGAQGPMQFMPSTWAVYGEGDINDDHDAIQAAARYLRAAGGPGNMDKASDAYVTAIEKYAGVMMADARAFDGYHAWQVYVSTVDGTTYLPEGWRKG
jgi:hypothetical protein